MLHAYCDVCRPSTSYKPHVSPLNIIREIPTLMLVKTPENPQNVAKYYGIGRANGQTLKD